METELFERVLLPVAGVDDAHSSTRAASRVLPDDAHVDGLHVVEDEGAEGSVKSRKVLKTVEAVLEDEGITVDTHEVTADDVISAIHGVAEELDSTCILFTPRNKGGIRALFSGDLTCEVVQASRVPVIVVPMDD